MEELIKQLMAQVEVLESRQAEMHAMLKHGVTPPEWVSGKALALSLGIKPRSVEFYRYELGVIPVDGEVCRKVGRGYEYRIEGCRKLIEKYKALPVESQRALRESWQQCREVA